MPWSICKLEAEVPTEQHKIRFPPFNLMLVLIRLFFLTLLKKYLLLLTSLGTVSGQNQLSEIPLPFVYYVAGSLSSSEVSGEVTDPSRPAEL